jgi:ferrous iron transport protein B
MPSTSSTFTVALIGNPNTGKSTLFSRLSGAHARIGNFPGVTVEKKVGRLKVHGQTVQLIDLPGTYSIAPRSPDEMVSVDVLLGRQADTDRPDAVVCIADASNLERNLYLFSQLRDIGLPIVLVLNMMDQASQRGIEIQLDELERRLGIPIVATSANKGEGIDELKAAIVAAVESQAGTPPEVFPQSFVAEVNQLETWLASLNIDWPQYLARRAILDVGGQAEADLLAKNEHAASRLTSCRARLKEAGIRVPASETICRYRWIRETLQECYHRPEVPVTTTSDRIDRWLTHRIWGLVFFALVMLLVFQTIYTWSAPLMDLVAIVQGSCTSVVEQLMAPGILRSLLSDGLIAGVGSVIVFLPQIILLFFFIALLEDCGYMARAAFVMDKLMTRLGLSGKSFVPLMSSFACAIPGVMATRVIENRRDRMVTILVAPLMSCSARLPVYVLLTSAFIPATTYLGGWLGLQGIVLFLMHLVGLVVAVPVAWILKRYFFPGDVSPFVMELPSLKWPSPRVVIFRVYDRARGFVVRAGTLIFATIILVWAAGYFPVDHAEYHRLTAAIEQLEANGSELTAENQPESERLLNLREERNVLGATLIEGSFLGQAGKFVEPVVRPLGWDWKIGMGALASFPAREVIIATLGTIYSLGGDIEEGDDGLIGAMKASTLDNGRPVYTIPVALSIMVFFALCAQCGATLAVIRRETNSWRWPIFTFVYMTVLAYVAALLTYQIARLV